jgi:transposase-like protein
MASIRSISRRRKEKVMGAPRVITQDEYGELPLDSRVDLIRALIPIGLQKIQEELDREVVELVGAKHSRKDPDNLYRRHGTNPGSVPLADQRIPIRVPRVRSPRGEKTLRSYEAFQDGGSVDDRMFRRVFYGISCRNYELAAESVPGAIGLSSSTVSRRFIQASAKRLREFQDRDLSSYDVVTLFLDGKTFAEDEMVVALGVTLGGEKVILGFVQTATENGKVIGNFLRSLRDRGLDVSQGLLVVTDGSKGLRSGVRTAFRGLAVMVRCQWHKRENVVKHLPKRDQAAWRRRLQNAYERPTYSEAKRALQEALADLEEINQSAAGSLREGFEETLTLHRLGVFAKLGISLKTTNCIESIMSMAEERCGKVDSWT